MVEYENWLRRQEREEAEKAMRLRNTSSSSTSTSSRQEMPLIMEMTVDRVQSVMQEALREEFRKAKQSTFERRKSLANTSIQQPHLAIIGKWGEKLGLTAQEKELISGKFQFRRPKSILEFDYKLIELTVYDDHIRNGLAGHISVESFAKDRSVIFSDIRRQIANPRHEKETLVLRNDKTYERQYIDNGQPGSPSWYEQR